MLLLLPALAWGGYRGWQWNTTREFRRNCELARQAQDWRSLRNIAGEWAAWNPAAGRAWWYAAEAAQERDDLEDMAACLGNVPETDPKVLFALVEKANLEWTTLNRPLDGLKTSEKLLAMDPRLTEIQSRLISFYAMTLQRAPMLRAIRASIEAGAEPKESYPYLVMADVLTFSNGGKLNSRWLVSSPDEMRLKLGLAVHTAMSVAQEADANSSAKSVALNAEATQQLNWFLEAAPHDPVLLTFLMYRAYEAGNVERVGELLQRVDETGADDHMIWVFRCWYHLENEEFAAAEEAVQEALRLHPLSQLAHHEYAKLLRKMQRPEAEVERYQRIAADGKELRRLVLQLKSAVDSPPDLFKAILAYAQECGDQQVADALARRLEPEPEPGPFGMAND